MSDVFAWGFYYSVIATAVLAWVLIVVAVATEIEEWWKRK
jgi:hypothetical protein